MGLLKGIGLFDSVGMDGQGPGHCENAMGLLAVVVRRTQVLAFLACSGDDFSYCDLLLK